MTKQKVNGKAPKQKNKKERKDALNFLCSFGREKYRKNGKKNPASIEVSDRKKIHASEN